MVARRVSGHDPCFEGWMQTKASESDPNILAKGDETAEIPQDERGRALNANVEDRAC